MKEKHQKLFLHFLKLMCSPKKKGAGHQKQPQSCFWSCVGLRGLLKHLCPENSEWWSLNSLASKPLASGVTRSLEVLKMTSVFSLERGQLARCRTATYNSVVARAKGPPLPALLYPEDRWRQWLLWRGPEEVLAFPIRPCSHPDPFPQVQTAASLHLFYSVKAYPRSS